MTTDGALKLGRDVWTRKKETGSLTFWKLRRSSRPSSLSFVSPLALTWHRDLLRGVFLTLSVPLVLLMTSCFAYRMAWASEQIFHGPFTKIGRWPAAAVHLSRISASTRSPAIHRDQAGFQVSSAIILIRIYLRSCECLHIGVVQK